MAPYKVGNFHHGDFYDFQKLAKDIMNTEEKTRREHHKFVTDEKFPVSKRSPWGTILSLLLQ